MTLERNITEEKDFDCQCQAKSEGAIEQARANMPDEDALYDLADFFKVLGDSTRVRILMALDCSELCVCDLAELLSMTKSAVSHRAARPAAEPPGALSPRGKERVLQPRR